MSIHGDLALCLRYTGTDFVVHFFTRIIIGRELNVDYKNFADLSIEITVSYSFIYNIYVYV